jgi:hypothetical protein
MRCETLPIKFLMRNYFLKLIGVIPCPCPDAPLIVGYSYHKTIMHSGSLWNPLIDPLIKAGRFGSAQNYITIGNLSGPEAVPSIAMPRTWSVFGLVAAQFLAGWPNYKDFVFIRLLYSDKDMLIPRRFALLHQVRTFILARYFQVIFMNFAKACPEVYVTVYYNAITLGIISAFKKMGKLTCDIQHGYIGPQHNAYSNAPAFTLGSIYQPELFLVWDDRFKKHIENAIGATAESTANIHLKFFASEIDERETGRYVGTVLVTLSWWVNLPAVIENLIQKRSDVLWLLRPHPFATSSKMGFSVRLESLKHVSVCARSGALAAQLSKSQLHLTFDSSAVFEAAALGIRSVFMSEQCKDRFLHEVRSGLATYSSPDELEVLLDELFPRSSG